jgi:arylsulfate sulfotransferase
MPRSIRLPLRLNMHMAAAVGLAFSLLSTAQAMELTLRSSFNPPSTVGQVVTWRATTNAVPSSQVRYRFRSRLAGREYRIIRDYSPNGTLDWTAAESEGVYEIEVSARNLDTGESTAASSLFQVNPRISGANSLVSPTANPLVFLFSAPACRPGGRMRIEFGPADSQSVFTPVFRTPFKPCRGGTSMNFYLAGIRPDTDYRAHPILDTGSEYQTGDDISFRSGTGPTLTYPIALTTQLPPADTANPVILTSNGVATDLSGTPIWRIEMPVSNLIRPDAGGYFWGIVEDEDLSIAEQAIRKMDLTGMIVLETNAERVNEQLTAMGKRSISSFHHEVRTLPDGKILALAAVEQILTDVQGPGDVNVMGDMIVILDDDLRVVWTWDTFDWLDVTRQAVLGEKCLPGASGCPPFYLTANSNDWTHGNAVSQTPDGHLLYSTRHQDWLVKIHYDGGSGDGHIIYRLGKDGDITIADNDPWPWFSHQHDGSFERGDPTRLIVYDNGNTRWQETGNAYSRGQVFQIDEANHSAKLVLNADLGVFSPAVGSAQKLRNGNYHFDSGYVIEPDQSLGAYSTEVSADGTLLYTLRIGTLIYRTFRMTDIYTPN